MKLIIDKYLKVGKIIETAGERIGINGYLCIQEAY